MSFQLQVPRKTEIAPKLKTKLYNTIASVSLIKYRLGLIVALLLADRATGTAAEVINFLTIEMAKS